MRHIGPQLRQVWHDVRRAPSRSHPPIFSVPLVCIAGIGAALAIASFPVDRRISLAMLDEPAGSLAFLRIATDIGLVRWYIWPMLGVIIALTAVDWRRLETSGRLRLARTYAYACHLFGAVALAGIVTNILKVAFGRARPALLEDYGSFAFRLARFGDQFASFPSGHSTTMGAVTATFMVLAPQVRLPIFIVGFCLALSRIVVRAHFPSDVLAGFTIGFVTSVVIARFMAGRGLGYSFAAGGTGLRGLLPVPR
ncbi:undecaprenyl-diphosphatase [Aureimonas altamirensis DSM 21988]|uniref:Undecaprenyl-diphosphatase n=1 Tax=Aureimonas altamirensis DSM 21988 TaxID=1121026 RepID=A0ABY1IMP9_9HYPH|nr:phosphatase PAP2 family protein [Aureimonas altamirensis]SHJ49062.1 undecaprenyl-diphosphatase [Aureimonas altamirensis DSM 21988]